VSVITAGAQVLSIGLLVGMGDAATKEAFEWVIGNTDAIWACGEVSRFMDDMSAFKVFTLKVYAISASFSSVSKINRVFITSLLLVLVHRMVGTNWM
jgi:hypothetical protein